MRVQAATEVRKEVNELDNLTTGKAVDVLLNYETVKLFNNEQLEVDQYDAYLLGFQVSCSCERLPLLGSRLQLLVKLYLLMLSKLMLMLGLQTSSSVTLLSREVACF